MKLKKLGIILFLLCSVVVTVCYGEGIASERVLGAKAKLEGLGLIPQSFSEIDLDSGITREQAILLIGKLRGMEVSRSTNTVFSDVTAETANSGLIKALYDLGIAEGYADGRFAPEEKLTYEQWAKFIVSALDYHYEMIEKGNTNYMGMVSSLKISPENSYESKAIVSYGDVLVMMAKAVDTKIKTYSNIDNTIGYGQTFLEVYHNIISYEGVVTGSAYTRLTSAYGVGTERIEIDGEIYDFPEADKFSALIGNRVKYYYNDKQEKIIYLEKSSKQKIMTITAADIDSFEDGRLYYVSGMKKKNVSIPEGIDVIYNQKVHLHPTKSLYTPLSGSVTLIDNDNDGKYEVAVIDSYKNYFIESRYISTNVAVSYDKEEIDLDDTDRTVLYYKNGEKANIDAVAKNSVISIGESEDGELVSVYISNEYVSGGVDSVDEDEYEVYIDGEKYIIARDFMQKQIIQSGQYGDFYFNFLNEVAGVDEKLIAGQYYGYMINASYDIFEETVTFKILTNEGKIMYFTGKEKVLLNDIYSSGEDLIRRIRIDRNGSEISMCVGYPVLYKITSKGYVSELYDFRSDKIKIGYKYAGPLYRPGSNSFRMSFYIDEETTIFRVPYWENVQEGIADDSDYGIYKISSMSWTHYGVEGYNLDDVRRADLLVIYDDKKASTLDEGNPYGVVDKVLESVNDDNEKIYYVDVYDSGEKKRLAVSNNVVLDNFDRMKSLKRGDVIQYNQVNGITTCIKRELNRDNIIAKDCKDQNPTATVSIAAGQAYANTDRAFVFSFRETSAGYDHSGNYSYSVPIQSGKKVTVYDRDKDEITVTSDIGDMRAFKQYGANASYVWVKLSYMDLQQLYIINY